MLFCANSIYLEIQDSYKYATPLTNMAFLFKFAFYSMVKLFSIIAQTLSDEQKKSISFLLYGKAFRYYSTNYV